MAPRLCAALGTDISLQTLLYKFMELVAGSWTTNQSAIKVTKTKSPFHRCHDALRTVYADSQARVVHEHSNETQMIDVEPPLPTRTNLVSADYEREEPGMPNAGKIWALDVPPSMQAAFVDAAKGMLDEVLFVRTMPCKSRVRVPFERDCCERDCTPGQRRRH